MIREKGKKETETDAPALLLEKSLSECSFLEGGTEAISSGSRGGSERLFLAGGGGKDNSAFLSVII